MTLAEYTRGTQPLVVTPGGPSRQEQAELPTSSYQVATRSLGRPEFPEGKQGSQDPDDVLLRRRSQTQGAHSDSVWQIRR